MNAERTRQLSNLAVRLGEGFAVMRAYESESQKTALLGLGLTAEQLKQQACDLSAELGPELAEGRADALLAFARGFGRTDRRIRVQRPKASELRPDPALETPGLPALFEAPRLVPLASQAEAPQPTPIAQRDLASYMRKDPAPMATAEGSPAPSSAWLPSSVNADETLAPTPVAPVSLPFRRDLPAQPPKAEPAALCDPTGTLLVEDASVATTSGGALPPLRFDTFIRVRAHVKRGADLDHACAACEVERPTFDLGASYWERRFISDASVREAYQEELARCLADLDGPSAGD